MQQATQTYPQYNPSACTSCQKCLNNCPKACIYFDPLFIMSNECILCRQCFPECPEGAGVVLAEGSKLLGKEWFWFVQPPASESNTSKPSNPSDKGDKDPSQESSKGESSEESKGDSSTDSSTKPSTDKPDSTNPTPTNPTTPEIDSILTPPPKQDTSKHKSYKRDRFSKAIFAEPTLKILCTE